MENSNLIDYMLRNCTNLVSNRVPKDKNHKCWNVMENKAEEDNLTILLHEEIGFWGTSSQDFLELLNENKGKDIDVDINSPGGLVNDGFSIYNSLKSHDGTVNIKVSGVAASIASIIFLAGDNREISETAEVMIHEVTNFVRGTVREIKKGAERTEKTQDKIIGVLGSVMKDKTPEEIKALMEDQTWFNAEEAVENGFAHTIVDTVEDDGVNNIRHDFALYNYAKVPKTVIEKYGKTVENIIKPRKEKTSGKEEKPMDLKEFKNKHPELFNQVENSGIEKGVNQERDRVSAHLIMGEASNAMKTALKAVKEGTEMNQTLQAEYMAAGMKNQDTTNRTADDAGAGEGANNAATADAKKEAEEKDADAENNIADAAMGLAGGEVKEK